MNETTQLALELSDKREINMDSRTWLGKRVSVIGLGAMHLSLAGRPERRQAVAVIHKALDFGVTFIDTADSYCLDDPDLHHNERLIAEALQTYGSDTSRVCVASKGGMVRPEGTWQHCGDPDHLSETIEKSVEALGRSIFLWQLHAPDPNTPISRSLEAAAWAQQQGLVEYVGVSNFSKNQILEALSITPIVSVQNRYNFWDRSADTNGVLEICLEKGLLFFGWGSLGGTSRVHTLTKVPGLHAIAKEKGISVHQLMVAWLVETQSHFPLGVIPLIGASRVENIKASAEATRILLTKAEHDVIGELSSPHRGSVV